MGAQQQLPRFGQLNDGQLDTALNNARRDGVASKARGGVNAQLFHHPLPVLFDGFDTDPQAGGDFFVALAFGNQLENLRFARSEAVTFLFNQFHPARRFPVMLAVLLGNRRAEKSVPFLDFPDGLGQKVDGRLFEQVTHRP